IEEFKKQIQDSAQIQVRLYTDMPLTGPLARLPNNWEARVLGWPPRKLWTQIRMSIEMLLHPPDVLFIPAHVFPLIRPKKTVMTIHDIAAIRYRESYSRFERWYSVWSAKRAMATLWKIITPSVFTKAELQTAFGTAREKDIMVVPHGYDTAFQKIHDTAVIQAVQEKYNIKKPYLISIGRLEAKKNTARIVDAFNILKASIEPELATLQLLLIGKPGYGYEHVKRAIEESPYSEDIVQPGWVAQGDLPALMNGALVFVFPSVYEGFGLPLLEAMACGVPVVASYGNSAQEVGGRSGIYIHPEDSDAIANAVRKLLLDHPFREEQIAAGTVQAAQYSWKHC
ncbi:MAG: hypothetical protein COU33_00010, partial [Candidatus Magasanikbacteria bacterium CG10_big_fil_rev_8_21_14_0_10_43_6]